MHENLGNNFEYEELSHTSIGGIWGICTMDEKQETSLRRHVGNFLEGSCTLDEDRKMGQRNYIMDENIMKWAHSHGKATVNLT